MRDDEIKAKRQQFLRQRIIRRRLLGIANNLHFALNDLNIATYRTTHSMRAFMKAIQQGEAMTIDELRQLLADFVETPAHHLHCTAHDEGQLCCLEKPDIQAALLAMIQQQARP